MIKFKCCSNFFISKSYLFALLAIFLFVSKSNAAENPVLLRVADSGVLKYNGEYYLMGTGTSGQVYVSADLIHWRGPIHVFSMHNNWTFGETAKDHQIHACDLNYVNGIFHLYWSVNHRGEPYTTRRIGHATSKHALGPYDEPVKDTWFNESIDAHLFMDNDGTPYFYSVKFTDGNTIWGSELSDPWLHKNDPKMLLTASPMTWECSDHKVIEGPYMIRYRNQYYMLYNANHTSARWGNYGIGCAVADHPLDFNNAAKYSYPLIRSNQERIRNHAKILLHSAQEGLQKWTYTTALPPRDWRKENFDDGAWHQGESGFGYPKLSTSSTRLIRTDWKTPDIWMRCKFKLTETPSRFVQLKIAHYGATEVYLNEEKIYEGTHVPYYALLDIVNKERSLLQRGENIIAVHSQRIKGSDLQYIDAGLLDPQVQRGDELIFNPGQPSLVRGVNGFEWWLVYFAIFNSGPRSQAVDRVYFFDKALFIDGPTSARTPGYHPNPAQPAFGDIFNRESETGLGKKWNIRSGSWRVADGEAFQTTRTGNSEAFINCERASHYLFEANLKFTDETGNKIGVIACRADEHNYLNVFLDQQSKKWGFAVSENGNLKSSSFLLPTDFNYSAYHNIRVTKNSGNFEIRIDNRASPGENVIRTSFAESGKQGIYTENAAAAFDGIIYTMGWDEFDANICGWGNSLKGEKCKGDWSSGRKGITQNDSAGEAKTFKGDLSPQYEMMCQLTANSNSVRNDREMRMGIYPVYVDSLNWLRADIDMKKNRLFVYGKKKGRAINRFSIELSHRRRIYPRISYSDRQTKTYKFGTSIQLSGLEIVFQESKSREQFSSLRFFCQKDGRWESIPFTWQEGLKNSFSKKINFNPLFTDALRIKEKTGEPLPEIDPVYADIISKPGYNLRAVKLADKVIIFVDGKEMITIEGAWPPSQVGLVTTNVQCRYNGITCFNF